MVIDNPLNLDRSEHSKRLLYSVWPPIEGIYNHETNLFDQLRNHSVTSASPTALVQLLSLVQISKPPQHEKVITECVNLLSHSIQLLL